MLEQLRHLRTYPAVREKLERGELTLHGWWFDIANADVYAFEQALGEFVIIDDREAERILDKIVQQKSLTFTTAKGDSAASESSS